MHHPFHGIYPPNPEHSKKKAAPTSTKMDRRKVLVALAAAAAGLFGSGCGGPTYSTLAEGEEGGGSTEPVGEEGGGSTARVRDESGITTNALGEEGGSSTEAVGEEGGDPPDITTKEKGEERGNLPEPEPSSDHLGEEG